MNNVTIFLSLLCIISIIFNFILLFYSRKVFLRVFYASEEASIIFTRLDTFKEHLQSVYEMPTFYGDETLNGLLTHANDIAVFLSKYENVYSFTQPDLMEQLEIASKELQEKYEQEEPQEE